MSELSFAWATWFFARALAAIYVIAFVSLAVQVKGLLGSRGILPVTRYLGAVSREYGRRRSRMVPTLFWLDSSDFALMATCWFGAAAAALAFFGIAQSAMFFASLICYISLVSVGQDFLSFQWDVLLIEAGFVALFLLPFNVVLSWATLAQPPLLVLFLLWWLLFRLNFQSGVVKLSSRDVTWRNLTAMSYHYETQPLPNPAAWLMHQLPVQVQRLSVAFMFAAEIGAPFLIFMPSPTARHIAFIILAALQVLIIVTGNFGFFNYLTIALCFMLLDDNSLVKVLPRSWLVNSQKTSLGSWSDVPILIPIAGLLVGVSLVWVASAIWPRMRYSSWLLPILRLVLPFKLVNTYGLFAVMTTSRPEIIIEGSDDGENWKAYEFRFKPGNLRRAPPWVAPHMPRLDWQMWFAAMSTFESTVWIQNLFVRLLQGEPDVLKLLAHNPFENKPPQTIRALLYDYKFTALNERRTSGAWWKRELLYEYSGVAGLSGTPL